MLEAYIFGIKTKRKPNTVNNMGLIIFLSVFAAIAAGLGIWGSNRAQERDKRDTLTGSNKIRNNKKRRDPAAPPFFILFPNT